MRLAALTIALTLFLACTSGEGAEPTATPASSTMPPSHALTPAATAHATMSPTPTPTPTSSPAPSPTVSPTPVPIYHPPPYLIAIEAGHGGPYYWGGSVRDGEGRQYIEKDLTLQVALKLHESLLGDEEHRYIPVLVRDGDYTLTNFDAGDYRGSQRAELQARVDVANAVTADALLSIHFNGWHDAGQTGTETYCNPDRSFGFESCQFAWFVQNAVVAGIRAQGYEITDRGTKNDAEVGGDPSNPHSFLLGTNHAFNPSLMPGVISEVLFLSGPADLEFLKKPEAVDIIAQAYKRALDEYFAWLVPVQ